MKKIIYIFLLFLISSLSCTVVDSDLLELVLEIKNQNQELLDEVKSLQVKSDSLIIELKKSTAKQEELLNKVTELQAELTKVLTQIGALTEKLDNQDADLEAIKAELADLQEKYQAILEQLEQLQQLSQILAEIEMLKVQLIELDEKYQEILQRLTQNEEELASLKSSIEALQTKLAENLNKISELISTLGEQGADIKSILEQLTILQKECEQLKSSIEQLVNPGSNIFYEENGTIKCQDANPGDKGFVNGKEYEAVDRELLIQRRDEGADLTCVCTSLVTDMSSLFQGTQQQRNTFNQKIGSWDLSNVTTISKMFYFSDFNEDIENWNLTKVKNMNLTFANSGFNSTIEKWNVGNVTEMSGTFSNSKFNQPLDNWDVSNVTDMTVMFSSSSFNQPLGNWDVSSVKSMVGMFYDTDFNHPIDKWNVENVLGMAAMFESSNFNQPLKTWNVSNVNNMRMMFFNAKLFNQDISNWCVTKITGGSANENFSTNSPLSPQYMPKWGTCPTNGNGSGVGQIVSENVDFNYFKSSADNDFVKNFSNRIGLNQISSSGITGGALATPNTTNWGNENAIYCSKFENGIGAQIETSISFKYNSSLINPNAYDRAASIWLNPKSDWNHYIIATVEKDKRLMISTYGWNNETDYVSLNLKDNNWYKLQVKTNTIGGAFDDQINIEVIVFDLGPNGVSNPIVVNTASGTIYDTYFAKDIAIQVSFTGTRWGGSEFLDNFEFKGKKSAESCNSN